MITENDVIEIIEKYYYARKAKVFNDLIGRKELYKINKRFAKAIIDKIKESRKVYDRKYRKSHKEGIKEHNRKYRLRKKELIK